MLNRIAREMAAEIASHDWSDAPFRRDRAGHQRSSDTKRVDAVLGSDETETVKINVAWVTAQVLKHADPNLDLHEYMAACGVPRSVTHRTDGSRADFVAYGLRWEDYENGVLKRPGAPLYRIQMQCAVPNLVVFKRLLGLAGGFDPYESPTVASVDSIGGSMRQVTVNVRDWGGKDAAARRAVEMVSAISTSVLDGESATLVSIEELHA